MSFLKKREVEAKVKTRHVQTKRGQSYDIFEAYFGVDPFTRRPIRKYARKHADIVRIIREFYERLDAGGEAAATLDRYEAIDARRALDLIAQNGLRMTLVDCVNEIMKKTPTRQNAEISLVAAYEKYKEYQSTRSALQVKTVKLRVGNFVASIGETRNLSTITIKDVEKYLTDTFFTKDTQEARGTYNGRLSYIKSFFEWCAKPMQGFLDVNPIKSMEKLPISYTEPEYAKPADVEKLFRVLEKHKDKWAKDLAYAILSFFCGMRQSEIAQVRLGEDHVRISLEDRFIKVYGKGTSKGKPPRVFTIPETAFRWMESFDFMNAIMQRNGRFREHTMIRAREAGIAELPENAGRHTFITMYTAAFNDPNALTRIVGNSEGVRAQNYDGVVTEREGREYFNILPSGCTPIRASDETPVYPDGQSTL